MSSLAPPPASVPSASVVAPEPWFFAVLRALIHALCALFALYAMTAGDAIAAGSAGAFLGALASRWLVTTALRTPSLALLSVAGVALSLLAWSLLRGSMALSSALGPATAAELATAVLAGTGCLSVSLGLRTLGQRHPAFRVLEVATVGFCFAAPFVAHRGGHINRPFELADSILAEGGDPSEVFRAVGAVAGALSVLLLLSSRSVARTLLHLGIAALLLPLLVLMTAHLGVPEGADPLGLRGGKGDDKNESDRPQGKGGDPDGKQRQDNEQLEFKDQYDHDGRQIPLAVVLLHDDYSPPSGMYYFRQAAFSQYNGRRLVPAQRGDVDRDTLPSFVAGSADVADPPGLDGRVEIETTVAMLAEHARPFAIESPLSIEAMQNPDPERFRRVYRVRSAVTAIGYREMIGLPVGDDEWNRAQRDHYLQVPSDPRYHKLAHEIASGLEPLLSDDGVARALSVVLWLGKEGTYSLESGHAGVDDPTADFLFGDRVGYCVHFAHAAVYLMRALGIPARVGTGYVVEEAVRQGGSAILLTGANAHAWPEVYLDDLGWVIMDVAPERALDEPPPPPDPDLQRLLGEMARGLRPMPATDAPALQPTIARVRQLWSSLRAAVTWGVPLCLLLLYLVKLWRRLSPAVAGAAALPRVAYRAELDRLSEVRLRRRFGESRERFAARLGAELPSFVQLTERHVADRYGRSHGMTRREYRALSRALRRERAGGVPWFRRALGLLTPWSFLRSR